MRKISTSIQNPYSHTPEEDLIAVRSKIDAADMQLIQSVFPGRSGIVTSTVNTLLKTIADYVRSNKLTYLDSATVESYIRTGFTNFKLAGTDSGPNDRGATSPAYTEASGDTNLRATAESRSTKKVTERKGK